MQRTTFDGEELRATWADVTLTTHRLIRTRKVGGVASTQTLILDKLEHASLVQSAQPALLLFAGFLAVLALAALLAPSNGAVGFVVLMAIAGVLALIWWATRAAELHVGAGGGLIRVRVTGGAAAKALAFLDAVERASVGL
ncbi:MAG: hypothetical protein KC619_24060 [Myxococcales bacterium]|nr:hypothetical protein [Myxococcales bacterium]